MRQTAIGIGTVLESITLGTERCNRYSLFGFPFECRRERQLAA